MEAGVLSEQHRGVLGEQRRTLPSDRRHLLEQFTLNQVARNVVAVGSMCGGDGGSPAEVAESEAMIADHRILVLGVTSGDAVPAWGAKGAVDHRSGRPVVGSRGRGDE
jgi:hypothetical protein